ncbi:MAG TPA: S-methyl-5-thioribose-1-phosphate isomerase [Caldisericia bacterium]|nr:S-methyl-5-thioribose-1-phosphate isomerase [Caldisericia bacterium]HPF48982.1 S-methyl-5-thioribose-1-phosphate isomerase [Caldisericia bacterium]HPI83154.1 S-methyl-5-thioribose-1-phosphate isomerase [Caldisericia bacterium]HPQ92381.1 S-methyl-5-thioribose-1-phosphate isomerase [Caldisericia bacterium]HRV74521.1 S-methyl-5-thioribose-1-phosphate isomerase [Caldisericia bacterium]
MKDSFTKDKVDELLALSKVPRPYKWEGGHFYILDQKRLPHEVCYIKAATWTDCVNAISSMAVRGAPAIGVCGAYAMAMAIEQNADMDFAFEKITSARPTAVNLFWATKQVFESFKNGGKTDAWEKARFIEFDDHVRSFEIARHGSRLIQDETTILTHCNTGSLAAGGFGTALGIIMWVHLVEKKKIRVINTETRPYLQGARLTSFELFENGVESQLIPDMAAGYLMKKGEVDCVIVGADRIALNGDTANKIGTYTLAVLAKTNNIPFYVAAPFSTFDFSINGGSLINIEERPAEELITIGDIHITKKGVNARNPAFDVTPSEYISGFITEKGVIKPVEVSTYRFFGQPQD